ncbi:outer membrane protein transport protein [uncultured Litoreibacter sp.]|uniref:OmpP1/FadL family transporter n=1 Tax=uncultured Litoreibacter sp. TaxID=1392394 RepID=UPI0026320C8A|nr:outer membrane protein transport protein [uncultured Litoreibacter sp.]
MKQIYGAAAILATTTTLASAGGIDRTGQFIRPLFEEGGETGAYTEFSFGTVSSGASAAGLPVDPLKSYSLFGFAFKQDVSEKLSFSVIVDQPIGASVDYRPFPFAFGISGYAEVNSTAVTVLGRYKFNENFSVHGGLRFQDLGGEIQTFVGGVSPARLTAGSDFGVGFVFGAAYERPDIAMRVALTYSSEIDVDLEGTELALATLTSTPTSFTATIPASLNLEFQTGIAKDTLLFGSVRYVEWEGFNLTTAGQGQYVNFRDDTVTYSLGVGRRFNENWSGAVTLGFEEPATRPGNTLLNPRTGQTSIGLGVTYTKGNTKITGGVTYAKLGSQNFASGLNFNDNEAVGAGVRIGLNF